MVELAPTSLRRAAGATDPAALSSLLSQLLTKHDRSTCAEIIDRDTDESGRSPLHHACWRGAHIWRGASGARNSLIIASARACRSLSELAPHDALNSVACT